jgi:protein-S-isoprenylcysteine O-methyltransferase Ste14
MFDFFSGFQQLPGYAMAAVIILLLYAAEAEIRFGERAGTRRAGAADQHSSRFLSLAVAVPVLGFILAMKANAAWLQPFLPGWFRGAILPWMPVTGWTGVALGAAGLLLRLCAVLTLRERYSRTLLVHEQHAIERGGPYRWVRHPGYLGSLLTFNGIALASGNWITFVVSFAVTLAAYTYRIAAEDHMLIAELGEPYAEYRRQVRALIPIPPTKL